MNRILDRLGLSETARIMCGAVAALCLGLFVLGLLVTLLIYPFEPPLPYGLGLLLGGFTSILKLVLMERSLNHAVDMRNEKSAKNYGSLTAMGRYLLTIALLLLVVFFPQVFGVFGTIFGILSLQAAAYIANAVLRGRESKSQK